MGRQGEGEGEGEGDGEGWRCTRNASLDNEQAKLENVNSEFYPVRCFAKHQQLGHKQQHQATHPRSRI